MEDPALETLRQRYAAGEVPQEEYKHIRQILGRRLPFGKQA
jgi:uncharacterized membrane protein